MAKFKLLALTAALLGCGAASADVVIDDFSEAQAAVTAATVGSTDYNRLCGLSNAIGGCRELFVQRTGGLGTGAGSVVTSDVSGGVFNTSSGTRTIGSSLVRWDGNLAVAAHTDSDINTVGFGLGGGLGIDLLAVSSGFSVDVIASDPGTSAPRNPDFVTVEFRAFTSAGQYTSFAFPADEWNEVDGIFTLFIDWGTFLAGGTNVGGGVNLSQVTMLEARINWDEVQTAYDITVDLAKAVPEPGALALLGIGMLGLGAARRRSRLK